MKQILLVLATLATAAQAFAISPRCEKALIQDAVKRIHADYPNAQLRPQDGLALNESHYYSVRVFVPGDWNSRTGSFGQSFYVYYTVQNDERCSGVEFSEVQ